jgi:excisionase family DNA binding protein
MKRHHRRGKAESEPSYGGSEIMTIFGVADYLHCHQGTIYRLLAKRAIPAFRLGSDWRFIRSDIDKWIENKSVVVSETEPEDERKKGKTVEPRKPKPRPSPQRAKKRRV